MQLGKRGWLSALLAHEVANHHPPLLAIDDFNARHSRRAVARLYLRRSLRESGLLFGTPSKTPLGPVQGRNSEEVLFLAVLRTLCRLALDVAQVLQAPIGPRQEQLLVLTAALNGQVDEALSIHEKVRTSGKAAPSVPNKLWSKVESALEERAMSLAGDPYYGLVLHNGAVYSDAQLFGHMALAYFSRGRFSRRATERRLTIAAMQKSLLVQVLIGLACAERKPSFPARRAILRQIDDLRLPEVVADATRAFAKKSFDKPGSLKSVVKSVRSKDVKRFILEQTLLASLVDGRRSPSEVAYLHALGSQLGYTQNDVQRLEVEMAEFYAKHREVVDVFTVSQGAEIMGEELMEGMTRTMEKNFQRLLQEVKETGELSVLLARAARGQTLTREERKAMREQLIDVAKAVPALAIFAAPGGVLLLIALAKVLPFNMLPSAFRDEEDENENSVH
ncbi:MAG: hypothetical protein K1X64_14240 [Myxococcaceae bacterium]|nr:hypothetical protein [Myxococcaceae bacterium]